jgi:hypothetical protein
LRFLEGVGEPSLVEGFPERPDNDRGGGARYDRERRSGCTRLVVSLDEYVAFPPPLYIHELTYTSAITADITVLIAGTVPQCIEPALTQLVGFIVQIFLVLRIQKVRYFECLAWFPSADPLLSLDYPQRASSMDLHLRTIRSSDLLSVLFNRCRDVRSFLSFRTSPDLY